MAKIELGGIVSKISGKLGPIVFTSRKTGTCGSAAPPPKHIQSSLLAAHQNIIAQANKDYTALSVDLKKFWREMAQLETTAHRMNQTETRNGRLFYLGWRIRCLHAAANIAFDFQPDSPIYYYSSPNITLFGVSFGFNYVGHPAGAIAPFPWSAAWLSWSPNGTAAAGRTWRKFWPVPGHEQTVRVVNLDPVIFNLIGIPPEWRPQVTGYYDQKTPVKIRHYRVYNYGKIFQAPDYDLWAPGNRFYFREPPRATVFSGNPG